MIKSKKEKSASVSDQSTDSLVRLFNKIPSMVGRWSRDGHCLRANPAYSEYFGKSQDEMTNIHIRDLLGPKLYEQNLPYIQATMAGHRQSFEREIPIPNGTIRHTLVTYTPDIVDGEVVGFFAFVADVTYLKNLEIQRRDMERQLVVSSRFSALGDMAGGIAHEINTPLSVVMMLIGQIEHYLGERSRTDEILKALRTMETAVFSISNIIKGLRTFAHEATNDPFQDVRVRDLISNTLVLCGEKFRVHNIDLHICDVASDLTCRCRPVEMRQVLFNLLINAFDAVSKLEDKWVRLDVTEDRDSLRFTITDSGKGIDPQIRESMMLPFFTTKPKGAGPGLGLAVSKSIVEDHQGTLLLDTNCVNTRFEVLIPKHLGKLSA